MIFFNLKIFILGTIAFLFIPTIASANQVFPPEIPVLFYGDAKINNNPAPINTVITSK